VAVYLTSPRFQQLITRFAVDDNTIGSGGAGGASSSGMQPNVAALLAYLFGWIGGLVFILIEKENKFVRFHAFQSLFLSGAVFAVYIALTIMAAIIGSIVGILILVVWLGFAVAWVFLMIKAYQGATIIAVSTCMFSLNHVDS
jgi:uncharacterized membrane protein